MIIIIIIIIISNNVKPPPCPLTSPNSTRGAVTLFAPESEWQPSKTVSAPAAFKQLRGGLCAGRAGESGYQGAELQVPPVRSRITATFYRDV